MRSSILHSPPRCSQPRILACAENRGEEVLEVCSDRAVHRRRAIDQRINIEDEYGDIIRGSGTSDVADMYPVRSRSSAEVPQELPPARRPRVIRHESRFWRTKRTGTRPRAPTPRRSARSPSRGGRGERAPPGYTDEPPHALAGAPPPQPSSPRLPRVGPMPEPVGPLPARATEEPPAPKAGEERAEAAGSGPVSYDGGDSSGIQADTPRIRASARLAHDTRVDHAMQNAFAHQHRK